MNSSYGQYVSWLNLQFYNGFGTLVSPAQYEQAVNQQGYDSNKLVAGMEYCDSANVDVKSTINTLSKTYPNFGGVFVWLGNDSAVLNWSQDMYNCMNMDDSNEKTEISHVTFQ